MSGPPRIGLALGAGGARGLAHIAVLEAFDELGLRPARIAGASMGAILGAAYAGGVSGKELRAHAQGLLRDRAATMARLLQARVGAWGDLFTSFGNPVLVDAEIVLDLFWPRGLPARFEDLKTPFIAIATDYYTRGEAALSSGPLRDAVAASMAIPGLVRPVKRDGAVLIDGGAVNPLPYDHLLGVCDRVIACDVTGGPTPGGVATPGAFEAMIGASQIMQGAITARMLALSAPDCVLRPDVEAFKALDFFRLPQILRASEPIKEDAKRAIAAWMA